MNNNNNNPSVEGSSVHWVKELELSQLMIILGQWAVGYTERSELEALIVAHVSHEEALIRLKVWETMHQVECLLEDDRNCLVYHNYVPSKAHQYRMARLRKQSPHIFDNPKVTPRKVWLSHPNWDMQPQMPTYHTHFREELQDTIRFLREAYFNERKAVAARQALWAFQGSMRRLNFHVSVEESHIFPLFQISFPDVDLAFLYEDHKTLHHAEDEAMAVLTGLGDKLLISKEDVLQAIDVLLRFDKILLTHLGEEEEYIVPMTLCMDELILISD